MIISRHGFRLNVGIIVTNQANKLLWCKRTGQTDAWQFPQGGIKKQETLEMAMLRELKEEVGLEQADVQYLFSTQKWLYYRLPLQYRRLYSKPYCIGQKQKWFLLRLISDPACIQLNRTSNPEFDSWRWVDYWYPVNHVVDFKKKVYKKTLSVFAPVLFDRQTD